MICTSCSIAISESSKFYKCRQCTNHFVCTACTTKEHNCASSSHRTLDEVSKRLCLNEPYQSDWCDYSLQIDPQTKPIVSAQSSFGMEKKLVGLEKHLEVILVELILWRNPWAFSTQIHFFSHIFIHHISHRSSFNFARVFVESTMQLFSFFSHAQRRSLRAKNI